MKEATRLPEPLLDRQREFLGFLRSRLGTEEAARDALQSAYVKAMEKADTIRDDDSTVAWFCRLLRNAVVDAHRREQIVQKGLEHEQPEPRDEELFRAICTCVGGIIATLKPEYAELVRRVELGRRRDRRRSCPRRGRRRDRHGHRNRCGDRER